MSGPALSRRLGLGDAVAIGLGSMIGAGVFAAFAPASQAAGAGMLVGLVIAAVVAFANATSTAQLAAAYPVAGGAYAYGRAELGPWWGFVAGWGFIIGKLASCAAMAMTFAAYAAPAGGERPVAAAAVALLVGVNLLGVTRTAQATRILVVVVLLVLAVVVAAGVAAGSSSTPPPQAWTVWGGPYGALQSAGILFFAFAGYARIATLGEEVRDPAHTIPRAILGAFAGAVGVYAVLAVLALAVLGPERLAASAAPLADVVAAGGWTWAQPVVRIGAAAASLGALLALIAGIGRTGFAMAREGDLPRALAAVHARRRTPYRAEIAVGVIVIVAVCVADLRGAIGFSSFGVLAYYLVANVAAWRQDAASRRYPRVLAFVGALGCGVLAVTLPWQAAAIGAAVLVLGVALRALRLRRAA